MLRIVVSDCGTSAVYIVYNNGAKMLLWGTCESIENGGKVSLLYVVTKYLFCKYDFRRLNYTGEGLFDFKQETLMPNFIKHLADVQENG
jgi:hypothetical protein